MATVERTEAIGPGVTVLRRVPYKMYAHLVDAEENWKLRMTYYDGTLEIMSPQQRHEMPSFRLGIVVLTVAAELGIPCSGTGSTTYRRQGAGVFKGKGKEPDQSFYVANVDRLLAAGDRNFDLDAGDPPPDLWIEVDNRSSSKGKLPVYAELGVPEVWRYRSQSGRLRFVRLNDVRQYEPIEHSLSFPFLTAPMVLEAMKLGGMIADSLWSVALRDWVRDRLGPLYRPNA